MTSNQIAYWNLQEQRRSNAAREYETSRSNAATEAITKRRDANTYLLGSQELSETVRHNAESEKETNRANLAKELETGRHNLRTEQQQAYAQAETQRHNLQTEILAGSQLAEAIRHNTAFETETNRSNLERERETRSSNRKNRHIQWMQLDQNEKRIDSEISVNEARKENIEQDTLLKKAELGSKGSTILQNVVSILGALGEGIAKTYAASKLAGGGTSLILK